MVREREERREKLVIRRRYHKPGVGERGRGMGEGEGRDRRRQGRRTPKDTRHRTQGIGDEENRCDLGRGGQAG